LPVKTKERTAVSWATDEKIGTPDHIPQVITTKPVIGVSQIKWAALILRTEAEGNPIPSGEFVEVAVYAVPAHYQLNLGAGVITCNASCMQEVVMAYSPGIVGHFRYDMRGDLIFGPLSSTTIPEGSTLMLWVYNRDIMTRDFSISLTGVLEKVS